MDREEKWEMQTRERETRMRERQNERDSEAERKSEPERDERKELRERNWAERIVVEGGSEGGDCEEKETPGEDGKIDPGEGKIKKGV